jgi:hypothetical protein
VRVSERARGGGAQCSTVGAAASHAESPKKFKCDSLLDSCTLLLDLVKHRISPSSSKKMAVRDPLPASIQSHEIFDTDLAVVTTPKLFHKMLRVLGCDASFFSVPVAHQRPLTLFYKMLRVFGCDASFFQ